LCCANSIENRRSDRQSGKVGLFKPLRSRKVGRSDPYQVFLTDASAAGYNRKSVKLRKAPNPSLKLPIALETYSLTLSASLKLKVFILNNIL
jgi:hypothetical protein